MMNKYQEAIDELRTGLGLIAYLFGSKETTEPLKSSKQLDALQELINKVPYYEELEERAKPMKPEVHIEEFEDNEGFKFTYEVMLCKACGFKIDEESSNFCNVCGQALKEEGKKHV